MQSQLLFDTQVKTALKSFMNKKVRFLFTTYHQLQPKAQLQAKALLMENSILMMVL